MRMIRLTLCLVLCLTLCSCSAFSRWMVNEDDVITPSHAPETILDPEQQGAGHVDFYLYYQVRDLVYMAPEVRSLDHVDSDEYLPTLIRELLKGPQDSELRAFFPEDTTLVEVSQTRDYAYVTLSREFLNAPPEAPLNWQDDPDWKAYVQQKRRLALFSLVNTVTQLSDVSRVQVLAIGENGQPLRLTEDHVGFEGENPMQPLEPLTREDSLIFTPVHAAETLLEAFSRKNWEAASQWIASYDPLYGAAPSQEEILHELRQHNPSLLSYGILSTQNLSGDLAVLSVRLEQSEDSGVSTVYESQPLRWVKQGSVWKLSYASLMQLMNHAH